MPVCGFDLRIAFQVAGTLVPVVEMAFPKISYPSFFARNNHCGVVLDTIRNKLLGFCGIFVVAFDKPVPASG